MNWKDVFHTLLNRRRTGGAILADTEIKHYEFVRLTVSQGKSEGRKGNSSVLSFDEVPHRSIDKTTLEGRHEHIWLIMA